MHLERAKKAAGYKAAEFIQNHMIVGLGTGSTAAYFIQALIARCQSGLKIEAVASSIQSQKLAESGKIRIRDLNDISHIDMTVDGADEIDDKKRMIKGGGGAHVREKILASSSREMIIIVDETKLVPSIGKTKLPIEVLPYGAKHTEAKIRHLGFDGAWRFDIKKHFFKTDNQNLIFDLHFSSPPASPETLHEKIKSIPGVIDTGFFFQFAKTVIVGHLDGTTRIL